ncbi:glutathione S-transferase N-terminal domain-containing protein [Aquabacter spiritensis]|uniref:Glutathione S-transferase n=1 Tax=Aquabacter spiritensis TaxID=933073 RepID=A0A4R3LX82_9HYPH|nr:glutathione S-transferase N-terminal domain-containing protein [Aquabacter spiritensis]TCT03177.1 glutathione S-transferase [Aquabacter spiritensis]
MRLRYSLTSPFARKVRVAAHHLGLPLTLELADTLSETDTLLQQNPLGKLPVLLVEGEAPVFDSPVILAYLDHLSGGGRLIPAEPAARFACLRLEALADGIMDAALLSFYETRFRPVERQHPDWVARQKAKIARALDALEPAPPSLEAGPTAGTIALACALAYVDLRLGSDWRGPHPNLVAWLDTFAAQVPGFRETAPPAA